MLKLMPYEPYEIDALESWLDEQARKGCFLSQSHGKWLQFYRDAPRPLRCRIDVKPDPGYHEDRVADAAPQAGQLVVVQTLPGFGDGVGAAAAFHRRLPDHLLVSELAQNGVERPRAEGQAASCPGGDPLGDVRTAQRLMPQGHENVKHRLGQGVQRFPRHGVTSCYRSTIFITSFYDIVK